MLSLKKEEQQFEKIIQEAARNTSEAYIWDICKNEVVKVPVSLKSINGVKKMINFEVDHRAKDYIKDLVDGIGYLKFFIPNLQLMFASKIEYYRGSHLEVSFPESFKRNDRRKDSRIEPLFPVYFKLDGLKKECFDISNGGFSFILNGLEFKNLKQNQDTPFECFIEFPNKKLKISATLVNVADIKPFQLERFPYGVKKLSFRVELNSSYVDNVEKLGKGMKKLLTDLL